MRIFSQLKASISTLSLVLLGITLSSTTLWLPPTVQAQTTPATTAPALTADQISNILAESYANDLNGDGEVSIVAFGDSITRGVGDFTDPGAEVFYSTIPTGEAGYPLRVEQLLGVSITNLGVPGERLASDGLKRFAAAIPRRRPDVVLLSGGSNDVFGHVSDNQYFRAVQTMINIAKAAGSEIILIGTPPSCCLHDGSAYFTNGYNLQMQALAFTNEIPYVNAHQAFINSCGQAEDCYLLNLPDGLHPNSEGYDILGEAITGALLRLDISSATGITQLEQVLNVKAGSLNIEPN